MRKIKKFAIALSAVACLGLGAVATTQLGGAEAKAENAYSASSLEMLQTASIRKDAKHGIRFGTVIGNNKWADFGEAYELTTLIIPENVLTAAEKTVDDLKAGATFEIGGVDVSPIAITYNGDESTLMVDAEKYPDCKVFCAVLNLSELSLDPEVYLNSNIVAHTYVKKADNTVIEIGTAKRAPALVAANALDAGEADATNTLDAYVAELAISGLAEKFNVGEGDEATLSAAANLEGVKVSYATTGGVSVEGATLTANEAGAATVTASIAGGKISVTQDISVVGDESTFRSDRYTPKGNFEFTVYGASEVLFNGTALNASDYTISGDTVTVSKAALSALVADSDNGTYAEIKAAQYGKLSFVATAGDVEVDANLWFATPTAGGVGEIPVIDILGSSVNLQAPVVLADGTVSYASAGNDEISPSLNFNPEYVEAMFESYPMMESLCLVVSKPEGAQTGYANKQVSTDGTYGTHSNSTLGQTSSTRVVMSRTLYNKLVEDGDLTQNVFLHFDEGKFVKDEKIIIHGSYNLYCNKTANTYSSQANRYFGDMPADKILRVQMGALVENVSAVQLSNYWLWNGNGHTLTGNKFALAPEGTTVKLAAGSGSASTANDNTMSVNAFGRPGNTNGSRLWIQTSLSQDLFWMHTTETPDASQTFTAGTEYTYALENNQDTLIGKYTITEALLDGKDIMAGEVEGVSITDAGIVFSSAYAGEVGAHRLQLIVEKTVTFASTDTQIWTSIDVHDRQITVA